MRPSVSADPIGLIGRVTGRIAPHEIGEVMLPFKGGTTAYHALAVEPGVTIETGTRVIVIDFDPPLTVYVDAFVGVTP